MNRLIPLLLVLSLAGCATFRNPATPAGVQALLGSVGVVADAINSYRGLCVQKAAFVYPACETIGPRLQAALRVANGQAQQANKFLKANPGNTVGLQALITQAQSSLDQLKSDTKANVPAALTQGF